MTLLHELKALLSQVRNPQFLPHFLEPLLFWGILIGVIAWILSTWVLGHRKAQICSLLLLAISSFAIYPLLHYRKKATPMTALSSSLMNEQSKRRESTQWVYYTLGGLSVLGIFMTGEGKGKMGTLLTLAIATGGIATSLFSLWLQEKEIAIFHPDARRQTRASTEVRPARNYPIFSDNSVNII